jgi:hypothetical protein
MPTPQPNMSPAEYRALMASGKPAKGWRGAVATPTTVEGLSFPSKVQAETYRALRLRYGPTAMIIREPILDLPLLGLEGGKPGRHRPDFIVVFWVPGTDTPSVSIHEAKGSKSAESRDWRLRIIAASRWFPRVPIFVWQRKGKRTFSTPLPEFLA